MPAAIAPTRTDTRTAPACRPASAQWRLTASPASLNPTLYTLNNGACLRLWHAAMDLSATYERTSDVPLLYAPGNLLLFAAPSSATVSSATAERGAEDVGGEGGREGEGEAVAMFVISHCGLARDVYLRQLMKHMAVDSYGKCLNNKELPPGTDYSASAENPVRACVRVCVCVRARVRCCIKARRQKFHRWP